MFADQAIPIAAWQLAGKLTAVLAGAAVSGLVLRRTLGLACIQKHHDEINGFNIVVLFVFVAAIMENVGAAIMQPVGIVAPTDGCICSIFGLFKFALAAVL